MIENVKIVEVKQVVEFDGVVNVEEVYNFYKDYVKKFDNLVILDNQEKDYKEILKEIKTERIPLKKIRSELNKFLKVASKNELEKLDNVIDLLDGAVEPIETALKEMAKNRKLNKVRKKKNKFMQSIIDINEIVDAIDKPYLIIEKVEWKESWNVSRDELVDKEIIEMCEDIKKQIDQADDKIKTAKMIADKVKNDYDLKSDIDYMELKEDLYLSVSIVEDRIEGFGMRQQEIELKAEEQVKEQLKREEIRKEEQEKARIEAEKKQEELDKFNVLKLQKEGEEKARLEKEAEKTTEKITVDDLFGEVKKDVQEKTKTITLTLEKIELSKAKLLKEFLDENKINYEIK